MLPETVLDHVGLSARDARGVLRACVIGGTIQSIARELEFDQTTSKHVLHGLEDLDLLEREGNVWTLTPAGEEAARAALTPPVRAATIERTVREFQRRLWRVNSNPRLPYRVFVAILFGSAAEENADRVPGVPIALGLEPRVEGEAFQEACEARRRLAESQRSFGSRIERELWPEVELFRILQGRSRALRLVDANQDVRWASEPYRLLYPNRREAREALDDLAHELREGT